MPHMWLVDALGALLTLLTLTLLGTGGYLLAVTLLGSEGESQPLDTAVAALLGMIAQALAIGFLLGTFGILRFGPALGLQALVVASLLRSRPARSSIASLELTVARTIYRLKEHPALGLIVLTAVGVEILRGLLRPPLSWDSLMYHLLLAATWLHDGNLAPVFGAAPINHYGYLPANGSLWLWWWLAPSHSELYVNLASLPHLLLLALATGGIARELGARRSWPLASCLIAVTPTVVRFAATQYVDILLGASVVAACFFALRWLRSGHAGHVTAAGVALGIAAGTKLLGVPYAAALLMVLPLVAPDAVRANRRQVLPAAIPILLLGGYFYARNLALGVGPAALSCARAFGGEGDGLPFQFPFENSAADGLRSLLERGLLLDALLGREPFDLGAGPLLLVALAILMALPFARVGRVRGAAVIVTSQIVAQVVIWFTVPYAAYESIVTNVRYLVATFGLLLGAGVAMAEMRGMPQRWLGGIVVLLCLQALLLLDADLSRGMRLAIGLFDLFIVALALAPGLRAWVTRRPRALALAALTAALALAPALSTFRARDRARALAREAYPHVTTAHFFAGAWGWLEQNGASGTVAVSLAPENYFVYPAMGHRLDRRALYVNVNADDLGSAAAYPHCDPRVRPSPQAWLANLNKRGVRWLHVGRYPKIGFPIEKKWAEQRPDEFRLQYQDENNRIYEIGAYQQPR
jgi:hypothetical protein